MNEEKARSVLQYRSGTETIRDIFESTIKDLTSEDRRLFDEWLFELAFNDICMDRKIEDHKDILKIARYISKVLTDELDMKHNYLEWEKQTNRPYNYRIGIIKEENKKIKKGDRMKVIVIGRPINGITANGKEYMLDVDNRTLGFGSEELAKAFLHANNYTDKDIKDMGIVFEEKEVEDEIIVETEDQAKRL